MEKIAAIELEMSRTQKNKATAAHLGSLKAKLAKLRRDLMEPSGKSGPKGEGFDVTKTGDCRVGLVGFPSVGKSTLLNKLTGTFSEVAAYEFTTLTCIHRRDLATEARRSSSSTFPVSSREPRTARAAVARSSPRRVRAA